MLDVYCPHHRGVVLIATDGLAAVRNTADGIVVSWRCPCGGRGREHLGRRAPRLVAVGDDQPRGSAGLNGASRTDRVSPSRMPLSLRRARAW